MPKLPFYIIDPATGDAAIFNRDGFVTGWDTTIQWQHARPFRTKPEAAIALFAQCQIDQQYLRCRILTEI